MIRNNSLFDKYSRHDNEKQLAIANVDQTSTYSAYTKQLHSQCDVDNIPAILPVAKQSKQTVRVIFTSKVILEAEFAVQGSFPEKTALEIS